MFIYISFSHQTCVINRITPKSFKAASVPYNKHATFPDIKQDPLSSNIYSTGERILLTWLNYCYTNYKNKIWDENDKGSAPANKWIVNFDYDLTDSLALASVIGAYCPFVVSFNYFFFLNLIMFQFYIYCLILIKDREPSKTNVHAGRHG